MNFKGYCGSRRRDLHGKLEKEPGTMKTWVEGGRRKVRVLQEGRESTEVQRKEHIDMLKELKDDYGQRMNATWEELQVTPVSCPSGSFRCALWPRSEVRWN
jgi:hypothetical protein